MAGVGAASGMTMGVTAGAGEHSRGFSDKALAEEARIAADQHAVRSGVGLHVGGNARHGEADIGHGELVGHNGPPTGGAEFDRCAHGFLHARRLGLPQGPYCNSGAGSASGRSSQ